MTEKNLKLKEIETKTVAEVIENVIQEQQVLIIELPDGEKVIIRLEQTLKPLPKLKGYVPQGWKDAIYNEQE